MKKTPFSKSIADLIEKFTSDLGRLLGAGEAKSAKAAPAAKVSRKVASPKPSRKPATVNDLGEARLLDHIRKNPGLRGQEIQAAPPFDKWPREDFKAALGRLRDSGQVKTRGVTRGTTYTAARK